MTKRTKPKTWHFRLHAFDSLCEKGLPYHKFSLHWNLANFENVGTLFKDVIKRYPYFVLVRISPNISLNLSGDWGSEFVHFKISLDFHLTTACWPFQGLPCVVQHSRTISSYMFYKTWCQIFVINTRIRRTHKNLTGFETDQCPFEGLTCAGIARHCYQKVFRNLTGNDTNIGDLTAGQLTCPAAYSPWLVSGGRW